MKKMRHMKRKALVALVLSVTMLLTLMPGLVFGVSDDQGDPDTVSSSIDYPTVNFTDVAPFLPPVSGAAPRRSPARAAGDTDPSSDNGNNGMVVNKTSVYNEETGAYDITLEAYATGSKVISTVTSDVPTDIVLVLDQSGSMGDDMEQLVYTAYSGNARQNSDLYEKQDNLWYKLSDGSYVAVTVTSRNDSIQYTPITDGRNNEDYDWWSGSTYTNLWDNKDDLYAKINGEYQKVTVSRSGYGNNRTYTYTLPDGTQIASSRGDDAAPAISSTDDGYLYLASIDTTQTVYTYTYTDANGTVQTIGTSTGDSTNFTAATLYSRSTTDSGITRLEALKNAAATFANSVEEKAKGADGTLGTEDDISHRIAVVGFASKSGYGDNTELLSIAGSNSGSAGTEPSGDLDQNSKSMNSACNWFMQQVSSNNGTPRTPSYYLSAADAGSLSSIFQQISDNIETGGSSSTLTEGSVVRDIISPQFTLPAGSTASDITLETYACTGKDGDTYTWRQNDTAMGATAAIDGNSVSVTGFDFSENYVGTVTNHGSVSYRGHKLVIRFSVKPQPGFLGGNNVPTNAGAGVYENKDSETPVREFPQPTVNVPIQPVTVAAQDYNVYLLGGLTASQLQSGSTVQVGSISLDLTKATDSDRPYGLEPWQTAYVDITVSLTGPDGSPVTDLAQLRADTSYTVSVTVSPKTEPQADSSGTPATKQSGSATGKVNVFKPTLTYEDGTVYYGDTFDRATLPGYRTSTSWFHNGTDAATVTMTGTAPALTYGYTYDTTLLTDIVNTKQDIPVKATISIGETDITGDTTFLHTDCAGETWSHTSGDPAFLLHVRTCALTVTKTGGADGEPYVFNVYRNGNPYTQVTVVGSSSVSIYELPVGKYTIEEDTGWSWRYDAAYDPDKPDGCTLTAGHNSGSITCTNTLKNDRWLNGFSDVIANIFGIRH